MIKGSTWVASILRLLLLIACVVGGIYLYQRYEVITVPPEENSMEIVKNQAIGKDLYREVREGFLPKSMVLVDLKPEKIWGGEVIVYRQSGTEAVRIGRVIATPGDEIGLGSRGFQVNNATLGLDKNRIIKLPETILSQRTLFADQWLVLNDNLESHQPDSRVFGVLPGERIVGKVIRSWPW